MIKEENDLIVKLSNDDRIESREECAYIMATVKHETAGTFRPIAEYGHGSGRPYGNLDPITHKSYYGRGYVQLTWISNYRKFAANLKVDLVNNPDLAMDPDTAYEIMVTGMLNGLFTGKKLSNYITDKGVDYVGARRIINGTDKAQLIASYATAYESVFE